jgi:pimeloyl-ACP methyl ester carboxylesterase
VICNQWGAEHINAHRALRQLSRKLSGAGLHVLRFDYFGAGDSAGDKTQADLPGWENDIKSALAELASITGSMRVNLIGLLLGATLAAKVAVSLDRGVNSLVLWDPVVNGRAYLDELYAAGRVVPTADGQLVSRPLVSRPPEPGRWSRDLRIPVNSYLRAN